MILTLPTVTVLVTPILGNCMVSTFHKDCLLDFISLSLFSECTLLPDANTSHKE